MTTAHEDAGDARGPGARRGVAHRIRRLGGRDPHEAHRVATPLELLFDLTFAAAFGVAGNQLAHLLELGHQAQAVGAFAFAMMAIVWAWINFTWFASAFDTDDWLFRVTTMVQMAGVLVLALGLPALFRSVDEGGVVDNGVVVAGYVVMRVALLAQWLRVARSSPAHRTTALTYVAFVAVAQVGWVLAAIAHLALGPMLLAAAVLYLVELGGPVVAELRGAGTPWHPHHIAERYSLLTIIALGEGVIGTVAAVEPIIGEQGWTSDAIMVVAGGTVLTFGLWWVYFSVPFGEILHAAGRSGWVSFVFGYGHIPLFAAIAAVGAGLHVAAYVVEGEAHVGFPVAVQAVAIPVGVFLVALFAIYALLVRRVDALHVALLAGVVAVLVLAVVLSRGGLSFGASVAILAVAPAVVVVGYEVAGHRHAAEHVASLRARG